MFGDLGIISFRIEGSTYAAIQHGDFYGTFLGFLKGIYKDFILQGYFKGISPN